MTERVLCSICSQSKSHLRSKYTSIRILMIRSPQNTETTVLRAAGSESRVEFFSLETQEEYKTWLSGGLVCSPITGVCGLGPAWNSPRRDGSSSQSYGGCTGSSVLGLKALYRWEDEVVCNPGCL